MKVPGSLAFDIESCESHPYRGDLSSGSSPCPVERRGAGTNYHFLDSN